MPGNTLLRAVRAAGLAIALSASAALAAVPLSAWAAR